MRYTRESVQKKESGYTEYWMLYVPEPDNCYIFFSSLEHEALSHSSVCVGLLFLSLGLKIFTFFYFRSTVGSLSRDPLYEDEYISVVVILQSILWV